MGIYNRIGKKWKEIFTSPPPLMVAPMTAALTKEVHVLQLMCSP